MLIKMMLVGSFAATLIVIAAAHADDTTNTIAASGTAEVLVTPDVASIEIGLVTSNPLTSRALETNSEEMARVVSAVRSVGIAAPSIQTSNFQIESQHPKDKSGNEDESRVVGYQVTNKVTVTVYDLAKVGNVVDAAVRAGANASNSVSFDIKDRRSLDDKVLAEAIRNARHNAEIMAAAENEKVGRMVFVTNDTSMYGRAPSFVPPPDIEINAAVPPPILPGQLTISAHVIATFAIQ